MYYINLLEFILIFTLLDKFWRLVHSRVCFSFIRGRFGQVHKCTENLSGLTLAAKIIKARSQKEKVQPRSPDECWTQHRFHLLHKYYWGRKGCKNRHSSAATLLLGKVDPTTATLSILSKPLASFAYCLHVQSKDAWRWFVFTELPGLCLPGCGEEWDPGDESAEPRQPHPAVRCLRVASRHHPGHGIVSVPVICGEGCTWWPFWM